MARTPEENARREALYRRLPRAHPSSFGCLYPLWKFGEAPTHECCKERRIDGKPYCPKHCAIAFEGNVD